ncbi:MAG: hypothetical protein ACXVZI_11815, partial [Terriglobales bacterium]
MRRRILIAAMLLASALGAHGAEVPQLSADAGPCWAEFTVTDAANQPAYLAKIHTVVRYGFM